MGNNIQYDKEPVKKTDSKRTLIIYSTDKSRKYIIEVPKDGNMDKSILEFKQAHQFFSKEKSSSNICIRCGDSILDRRIADIPLPMYKYIPLDYGWTGYSITKVVEGWIYNSRRSYNDVHRINDKDLRDELDRIIFLDANKYRDLNPEYSSDGEIILTLPDEVSSTIEVLDK